MTFIQCFPSEAKLYDSRSAPFDLTMRKKLRRRKKGREGRRRELRNEFKM